LANRKPGRNKNGFKIPLESLDITERQTRDFVARPFLERLGDFDGDLQRARETASAQPWIQQHYDIDAKLQAYANEYEKSKQHIEPEIQSETNRLLDDWYRDASVLVSEVAEWFGKAHDFEGQMASSSSADGGEIARMLAQWFDKPIAELPPQLRAIAEAYVPGWPELSAADRRARADEADRRLQAVLGARFEQANSEKKQAKNDPKQVAEDLVAWYAVTLDAMTWWGLGSVTPREAAMLLCRLNPHDDNLDPLIITTEETAPKDFKNLLRVFEDGEQGQSQARTLIDWHDLARNKRLRYHSWIDAFRQAVTEIAQATDTPALVPAKSQGQRDAAHSGTTEKAAPIGVTKREILAVDWPLPPSAPRLQNIIDSLPKWAEEACTKVGRVGKGADGSHLWNPAVLAACLTTTTAQKKWTVGKGTLTSFLRREFPDYLNQWEELAKSL
jgi:hypothetical protein